MASRSLRRFAGGSHLIIAVGALLLASLVLMSNSTEGSTRFGQLYSTLLVINTLGLLILGALIGWNLVRLLTQVRQNRAGARLTVRMVTMFVILSVTPVTVVYYFSLQFLHKGIDSWFDVRIEQALDDSLELSRTSLSIRMRELMKKTELLARDLSVENDLQRGSRLESTLQRQGATELTLMAPNGHIIMSSNVDPTLIVPSSPGDGILLQLRQAGNYIGLDSIADSGLHVRVVVNVPNDSPTAEPRVLQALYPITARMNTLADSVQTAYAKYRELAYLRKPLKLSFSLTLSMILLLSVFTSVWAAFYSARRMVYPLRKLVEGTKAVAMGNYETLVSNPSQDEVGFLVESFNEMTRTLKVARDETRLSQQKVEDQRTYLESVLTRLSSGVLTFDTYGNLITANSAAESILDANLHTVLGADLGAISSAYPHLAQLADGLGSHLDRTARVENPHIDWREEITLFRSNGRQILIFRGTPLASADHAFAGHIIVFDDVTELVQAQRNAAWSEVAQRLAHEIKNPLTPIQLSAERLRHKYLASMTSADSGAFDRLTRTIVQQVEAMKEMVNAFSEYARSPALQLQPVDVNNLIFDVVELYHSNNSHGSIQTRLANDLPPLHADATRIRQVLHNLIKNALEASEAQSRALICVETAKVTENGHKFVEIRIIDRGSGFPDEIVDRIFEPYVTTKPKGTGLGLAIVKKMIEEQSGTVWIRNNETGGASVCLRFPCHENEFESLTDLRAGKQN